MVYYIKFLMVLFACMLIGQPMGMNLQIISAEEEDQIFSNNSWTNQYEWNWDDTVKSSLELQENGNYERVEWTNDKLVVEHYSSSFNLIDSSIIDASSYTPTGAKYVLWGGYYSGENYKFVVTGQENSAEDDGVAVVRVSKYSVTWQYLDCVEYSGINTRLPFEAGSLRMTELNGELWIRTCHQMYQSEDGLCHQANMTFCIRESDLNKIKSSTEVSNYSTGYVSHSFNQFIINDGENIYGADHGDAYPRGIVAKNINHISSIYSYEAMLFNGNTGDNYTGATFSGFETADYGQKLIFAGTVADQEKSFPSSNKNNYGAKNLWVGIVPVDGTETKNIYLTEYAFDGEDQAAEPVLVKINENYFLLMWASNKVNRWSEKGEVHYCFIDSNGTILNEGLLGSDVVLSDCKPVLTGNEVVWYSTGNKSKDTAPVFYSFDIESGVVSSYYSAIKYTVKFDTDGGSDIDDQYVYKGDTVQAPSVPIRTGYTFFRWYIDENRTIPYYMDTEVQNSFTLYAKWELNKYSLNFDSNGSGEAIPSKTINYNEEYGNLPVPVREGYTFTGWYTEKDGGQEVSNNTRLTNDVTIYAHWKVNEYTLSFDSNGGELLGESSKTLSYGSAYSTLPSPSYIGHTFLGWYTAKDGGEQVTENTLMDANEVTVYAHWSLNKYTLFFDSNGGKDSNLKKLISFNDEYGDLPAPQREGYTFMGWYTEKEGGEQITENTLMGTSDNTVYAHWSINEYLLTFDANGGTVNLIYKKVKYSNKYGTLPNPDLEGHTFLGWYTGKDGGEPVTEDTLMGTCDVTVYAKWRLNDYTLYYDTNGGKEGVLSKSISYGTKYQDLPVFERDGYTFLGWYTEKDGGEQVRADTLMAARDVTIYIHWKANEYTLIYDTNDGAEDFETKTIPYETKYGTLPALERKGYTFLGWFTDRYDGNPVTENDIMPAKDVRIYAHWKANIYTLTFDADGGNFTGDVTRKIACDATYVTLPNPYKYGYIFLGWFTEKDGGQQVSEGTVMAPHDVTVYAHWKVILYSVYFDSEGGTAIPNQNVAFGNKVEKPKDPVLSGHNFLGWFTDYIDGNKYDFDKPIDQDLKLYAHWERNQTSIVRLSGETRFDTMQSVVYEGNFSKGGVVIVASGENYPDALAASGLAGTMDAPIVLTESARLSEQAKECILSLQPSRIIIVGGPAAISEVVEKSLESYCISVDRVYGDTRVDTSLALYKQGSGWGTTAIIATANNFADALSISSYAYSQNAPIFLVGDSGLTTGQIKEFQSGSFNRIVLLGGEKAVSESVKTQVSSIIGNNVNIIRLSGETRFETSEKIAKWSMENGMSMEGVIFATGMNFPDALAAGSLAGKVNAVTLLVENECSSTITYAGQYKNKVKKAYIIGGTNAITPYVADYIADKLGLLHCQQ